MEGFISRLSDIMDYPFQLVGPLHLSQIIQLSNLSQEGHTQGSVWTIDSGYEGSIQLSISSEKAFIRM